jgi:hypothetical protein
VDIRLNIGFFLMIVNNPKGSSIWLENLVYYNDVQQISCEIGALVYKNFFAREEESLEHMMSLANKEKKK